MHININTAFAAHADFGFNRIDKGGTGNHIRNPQFSHPAQNTTGASAAITDIGVAILAIADGMYQTGIRGALQGGVRFFFGQSFDIQCLIENAWA